MDRFMRTTYQFLLWGSGIFMVLLLCGVFGG
jgi:hypothetical protein